MSTYVLSDIHGAYTKFLKMLDKINLKDSDTLYILGDIFDRGPHPIKAFLKIMEMPNVIPMLGNHEYMALDCLEYIHEFLSNADNADQAMSDMDPDMLEKMLLWQMNGNDPTIDEFSRLNADLRAKVIAYIKEFLLYKELLINDTKYILVHGGLGKFSPDKKLEDYPAYDLIWERPDYNKAYYEDTYVITGHTPTQLIKDNPNPGFIFRKNNHIVIDCGACFQGGRLAAIRLEDDEEFYVE